MKIYIGAEPGGKERGYIFPFPLMIMNYLKNHGHQVTFNLDESVDIALCIAFNTPYETIKDLKNRGAIIVHRLDGRVKSIVKLYDMDEEVRRINKDLADWTIFQSEYVKEHTTRDVDTIFGSESPICTNIEHSSVIYNGVDRSIFHEQGERFDLKGKINILHVAITGGVRKGAKYVLKIADYLRGNPDYHFYLIGNQDRDLSVGHLIRDGIYHNVTHLGAVLDQNILAKYMRSCQIMLFPSVDDYCPNTVIEAMSCGLPVWYHNSGGTPELIKKDHLIGGLPINPENDIQPLAVLVQEHDQIRDQALTIVKKYFTSEIIGTKYLELFTSLLTGQKSKTICAEESRKLFRSVEMGRPSLQRDASRTIIGRIFKRSLSVSSRIAVKFLYMFLYFHDRYLSDDTSLALLKFGAKSLLLSESPAPLSEQGRKTLRFWFEVRNFVDRQINIYSNKYYNSEHPKHYMWVGHNQYLFDKVKAGERVLDVGCGDSWYQQWIAQKASEIVAIDVNPERVKSARSKNRQKNIRFELMDISQSIPEGSFDVAICSHVLEHLDNPIEALSNLAHNIPRLIVKVPLEDSHWMKLVMKDIGMFWMDDADHRREYSDVLLKNHLEQAGWSIVEMIRGYDLRAEAISKIYRKDRLGN